MFVSLHLQTLQVGKQKLVMQTVFILLRTGYCFMSDERFCRQLKKKQKNEQI